MSVDNLTLTAIAEFDAVIADGHAYGPDAVERALDRLLSVFAEIAAGRGLGHGRTDLGFPDFIRFRNVPPLPFIIVYDERTRTVLRLIRGEALHERTTLDDFDRA